MASVLPELTCDCQKKRCQFCLRCSGCCGCQNDDDLLDGVTKPTKGTGRKRKGSVSKGSSKKRKRSSKSSKKKKRRKRSKTSSPKRKSSKSGKHSKYKDGSSSDEDNDDGEEAQMSSEDDGSQLGDRERTSSIDSLAKNGSNSDNESLSGSDNEDNGSSQDEETASQVNGKSKSKKHRKRKKGSSTGKDRRKSSSHDQEKVTAGTFRPLSEPTATPKDIEFAFGWYEGKVTKKIPRFELRKFYSKREEINSGVWKSTINVLDNTVRVLSKVLYPANSGELYKDFNNRKLRPRGNEDSANKDSDASSGDEREDGANDSELDAKRSKIAKSALEKKLKKSQERRRKLERKLAMYTERLTEGNAFLASVLECARAVPKGSPEERVCHALLCGTFSKSRLAAVGKELHAKVNVNDRIREDAKRDLETLLSGISLFQASSSGANIVGSVRKGDSSKIRAAVTYLTSPAVVGYHAYGTKRLLVNGKRRALVGLALTVTQEKLFQRYKSWCDTLKHGIISRKELLNVLGALISPEATEQAEFLDSVTAFLVDDTFEIILQLLKEITLQQEGLDLYGPVDVKLAGQSAPSLSPEQVQVVTLVRRAYFFLKFHYHRHVGEAIVAEGSPEASAQPCHSHRFALGLSSAEESNTGVTCPGCCLAFGAIERVRSMIGNNKPKMLNVLNRCESAVKLFMAHRVRSITQLNAAQSLRLEALQTHSAIPPQVKVPTSSDPAADVTSVWVQMELLPIAQTSQFIWNCARVWASSPSTGPLVMTFDDISDNCMPPFELMQRREEHQAQLMVFVSHLESVFGWLHRMFPNVEKVGIDTNSHTHTYMSAAEISVAFAQIGLAFGIKDISWIQREPLDPQFSDLKTHRIAVTGCIDQYLAPGTDYETLSASQLVSFISAHFGSDFVVNARKEVSPVNGISNNNDNSVKTETEDSTTSVKKEDAASSQATNDSKAENPSLKSEDNAQTDDKLPTNTEATKLDNITSEDGAKEATTTKPQEESAIAAPQVKPAIAAPQVNDANDKTTEENVETKEENGTLKQGAQIKSEETMEDPELSVCENSGTNSPSFLSSPISSNVPTTTTRRTITTQTQIDVGKCKDLITKVMKPRVDLLQDAIELEGAGHVQISRESNDIVEMTCKAYAVDVPGVRFGADFSKSTLSRGAQSDGDTLVNRDGKDVGSLKVYEDMLKHELLVTAVPYFGPALHKSAPTDIPKKVLPPPFQEEVCEFVGQMSGVRALKLEHQTKQISEDILAKVTATKAASKQGEVARTGRQQGLVAGAKPGIEAASDSVVVQQAMEQVFEMQNEGELKLHQVDSESATDYEDVGEIACQGVKFESGWARRPHWVATRGLENETSVKTYRASLRTVLNDLKHARKRVPVDRVWKTLAGRHPGSYNIPTKTQVAREIIRVRAIRGDENVKALARADAASAGGDGREDVENGEDEGPDGAGEAKPKKAARGTLSIARRRKSEVSVAQSDGEASGSSSEEDEEMSQDEGGEDDGEESIESASDDRAADEDDGSSSISDNGEEEVKVQSPVQKPKVPRKGEGDSTVKQPQADSKPGEPNVQQSSVTSPVTQQHTSPSQIASFVTQPQNAPGANAAMYQQMQQQMQQQHAMHGYPGQGFAAAAYPAQVQWAQGQYAQVPNWAVQQHNVQQQQLMQQFHQLQQLQQMQNQQPPQQ